MIRGESGDANGDAGAVDAASGDEPKDFGLPLGVPYFQNKKSLGTSPMASKMPSMFWTFFSSSTKPVFHRWAQHEEIKVACFFRVMWASFSG